MDVGLDQARAGEAALGIVRRCLGGNVGLDGGDTAAAEADVDELGTAAAVALPGRAMGQACTANDKIEHGVASLKGPAETHPPRRRGGCSAGQRLEGARSAEQDVPVQLFP